MSSLQGLAYIFKDSSRLRLTLDSFALIVKWECFMCVAAIL